MGTAHSERTSRGSRVDGQQVANVQRLGRSFRVNSERCLHRVKFIYSFFFTLFRWRFSRLLKFTSIKTKNYGNVLCGVHLFQLL